MFEPQSQNNIFQGGQAPVQPLKKTDLTVIRLLFGFLSLWLRLGISAPAFAFWA